MEMIQGQKNCSHVASRSTASHVTKISTYLWLEGEDAPVTIALYCLIKCMSIIREG